MHSNTRRFLATTLLLAGMTTAFATQAQRAADGLTPTINLESTLDPGGLPGDAAQSKATGPKVILSPAPAPGEKLFDDPPPREGGWKGLANLLEAISPNVDTSIPLTPSQVTDRISAMMDSGQYAEALDVIDRRMAQREAENALGADVQLMFLRGRALAGLGKNNEAIEHYLNMTTLFPELPEPWNNLAVEYAKQGKLDMAQDALEMALTANPKYATARANLGWVQLMQAKKSFDDAQNVPGAGRAAQQTTDILRP